jgi:hypothetical protein
MHLKNRTTAGDDAPAKSLISLARTKGEDGDDTLAKSLKSWRRQAKTNNPHTPYALALAWRSRRACVLDRLKAEPSAATDRVGGAAP